MSENETQGMNLAAERLGAMVLAASDEFFAPAERLLRAEPAVFDPARYTRRGKWMDGWESRRRRPAGIRGDAAELADSWDWCLIRLGLAGMVRSVVVDTSHFKGNYPESCALEGCAVEEHPTAEELLADDVRWHEVLPRSPLRGDSRNVFAVDCPWRLTHLRLRIFPDGGVARLRVQGEPVPEPALGGGHVDLAAAELDARVLSASDLFFGQAANLLLPEGATHMGDGWETRRRRGPGHEWVLIRLAGAGEISRLEVDTRHFKGNAPQSCRLEGRSAPDVPAEDLLAETLPGEAGAWSEILPRTRLLPHTRHRFDSAVLPAGAVTHVRFSIFPDGGVARVRLFGRLTAAGRQGLALRWLDSLPPESAHHHLLACCGSRRWADAMVEARPFDDAVSLLAVADEHWWQLGEGDRLEAFAAHPRIGEARRGGSPQATRWSSQEQAEARKAGSETLAHLARLGRQYEERFGFLYLVCASGRSGEELLALLQERLGNDRDTELEVAAEEQRKITRLRLEKLLMP